MSTGGQDVVSAGHDGAPPAGGAGPPWRARRWAVALLLLAAGLVAGVALGRVTSTTDQHPPTAKTVASPGVVVPEVVDAETVPGTGGLTARPVEETADGARYDYSLVGAPWLAPDGTVRSGPPGCTLPTDGVQLLQVAVVHARPAAGGPAQDRVVWYRCRAAASP